MMTGQNILSQTGSATMLNFASSAGGALWGLIPSTSGCSILSSKLYFAYVWPAYEVTLVPVTFTPTSAATNCINSATILFTTGNTLTTQLTLAQVGEVLLFLFAGDQTTSNFLALNNNPSAAVSEGRDSATHYSLCHDSVRVLSCAFGSCFVCRCFCKFAIWRRSCHRHFFVLHLQHATRRAVVAVLVLLNIPSTQAPTARTSSVATHTPC